MSEKIEVYEAIVLSESRISLENDLALIKTVLELGSERLYRTLINNFQTQVQDELGISPEEAEGFDVLSYLEQTLAIEYDPFVLKNSSSEDYPILYLIVTVINFLHLKAARTALSKNMVD